MVAWGVYFLCSARDPGDDVISGVGFSSKYRLVRFGALPLVGNAAASQDILDFGVRELVKLAPARLPCLWRIAH